MYFKRKIDHILDKWITKNNRMPLLLIGIRQCGKTESIRELAKRHNLNLIEINFWNNSDYINDFSGNLDVDTIISNLSLRFPKENIHWNNTLIFFDEIQECPRARLSFKNFKNHFEYKVIGSGSYLGINGYVVGDSTPVHTGYKEVVHMKTMDFEEFLGALGYTEIQINNFFNKKESIPLNIHNLYKDLFLKYACIGGFPKVVSEYIS